MIYDDLVLVLDVNDSVISIVLVVVAVSANDVVHAAIAILIVSIHHDLDDLGEIDYDCVVTTMMTTTRTTSLMSPTMRKTMMMMMMNDVSSCSCVCDVDDVDVCSCVCVHASLDAIRALRRALHCVHASRWRAPQRRFAIARLCAHPHHRCQSTRTWRRHGPSSNHWTSVQACHSASRWY
jgi:hypothetical protein